ncbi:MAG: tyrosinase family protein [Crocinitomicaceae bacterium]|nr:tyrosinase family protein [Flavobacteriales bacterium]NQZ36163.1 tyrosinase family protein [Crocinitomicaceae bacterium]
MAKKKNATPLSRYDRVKLILNTAQGDQVPDYDGYRRFWELPIDELKEVVIYGIRMIAEPGEDDSDIRPITPPADSGGCCPHSGAMLPPKEEVKEKKEKESGGSCCGGGSDSVSDDYSARRGARSGLIIGLRGEFPFNHTQFPPLLWGTESRVSFTDIQFISDWIDDGCPIVDASPNKQKLLDLAAGIIEHFRSKKTENEVRAESGQLMVRKNIEDLTAEELRRYRAAIKKLRSRNELDHRGFDFWGRVHGNSCQHGWEKFFPWHRCLMHSFEQEIQDFDPFVTLSYWDWTNPVYTTDNEQTIPAAFQMWLEDADVSKLQLAGLDKADADLIRGKGNGSVNYLGVEFPTLDDFCYAVFWESKQKNYYDFISKVAGLKQAFFDVLEDRNPLWCPYRYLTKNSYSSDRYYKNAANMVTLQRYHHHYPTQDDMEQILAIDNFTQFGGGNVYNQSFGTVDMDPHNTIHIWSGGTNPNYDSESKDPLEPSTGYMLNNLTAGFDPIFYGHHVNIDRYWAMWQENHPGLNPDDGNSVLTPFNLLVRDTYNYQKMGYEYAMSSNYIPLDSKLESTRVKTTKLNISSRVKKQYKKASIRLHNVVQPNQSLIVRVFLNMDHPEDDSHLKHPENFVGGFTIFGHGQCIGSEGHCDPPSRTTRTHDLREQHHNTPGNYNLDATKAIQQLLSKGDDDFHINVLVIGTDGQDLTDMLRMDGVSLDFKQ